MGYDVNDTRLPEDISMEEKKKVLNESLDAILEEAAELGILESLMEEDQSYDTTDLDMLDEAVQFSQKGGTMTRTKQGWMNWYQSRAAIAYARAAKAPEYAKLVKYSRLRKKYIALINRKFKAKANMVARKKLRGAKAASISSLAKKSLDARKAAADRAKAKDKK